MSPNIPYILNRILEALEFYIRRLVKEPYTQNFTVLLYGTEL